jgi:hypothetical protein
VEPGIVMADSGLYSYRHFRMVIDAGADALFRVGRMPGLPVLENPTARALDELPPAGWQSWLLAPGAMSVEGFELHYTAAT